VTSHTTRNASRHAPAGGSDPDRPGRCRPSCCKTPFGHSTANDIYAPWDPKRCQCHNETTETKEAA